MQNWMQTLRYVTIPRFAELTGYSEKAIREKIRLGIFVIGKHYIKSPDNRIHIDLEAYLQWLLGQEA